MNKIINERINKRTSILYIFAQFNLLKTKIYFILYIDKTLFTLFVFSYFAPIKIVPFIISACVVRISKNDKRNEHTTSLH